MERKLIGLVMAGGRGTRFWPESTSKRPKQYISLASARPLLTESLDRFGDLIEPSNRFIVTVEEQKTLAKDCSKDLCAKEGIILEPSGRNTAPCILLAMAHLLKNGASKKDVVAIVPSDHVILNHQGFKKTLELCKDEAVANNCIATIGITPTFPHTGYGYIKKGPASGEIFHVDSFKEKPDFETAKKYLTSGEYLWNAGIFISTIEALLNEFENHAPHIYKFFTPLYESIGTPLETKKIYDEIPSDSIDYAIMEKAEKVLVAPAQFDWNDLGSWEALESVIDKTDKNTVVSSGNHYFEESEGNIIFAPDKFVSLINVNDLIVVSNEKSVMILPKDKSQKVKNIVEFLKTQDFGADLL
ncbi:MAG: mannose-1-phosphate guanylyltransferase [Epsilonproteobacteria bacterium]|nr:MAG: mannose-1-phosphate guanylyltransferase [Campylobacterota bacterium]